MPYLSQEALEGLKAYTYKPAGYTWLDDLHQPFWNWLVTQLPRWLAPNLITLLGLIGVIVAYYIIAIFQPTFSGESPFWVYFLAGSSVWAYANLDCIDGKQARRTKTSSPLGQLFDHGCDAYIVHLIVGDMIAIAGESCGWRAALGTIATMAPWMLAQLEEYHTGIMLYGNGLWGVLEALYAVAGLCIATGVVGVSYWSRPVSFLPIEWNIGLQDVVLVLLTMSGGVQVVGQIWRIVYWDVNQMPPTERRNKALGVENALWHFFLVFVLVAAGTVWVMTAEVSECRLTFTAYGTVYAFFATQLIVAHMAKIPFTPSCWCLLLLIIFAVNSALIRVLPLWTAAVAWLLYSIVYGHYVVSIVQQLCVFLDVYCLTIKRH